MTSVVEDETVRRLRESGFLALTGAGISTDSGIPDYRGPGSVARTPMTFSEFASGPKAQQRYWARAHLGWSRMGGARPNAGHLGLAALEMAGSCSGVITQNVDGLHEQAGSQNLVALHGRVAEVVCLTCGEVTGRSQVQQRLEDLNPGWIQSHREAPARPDGDVALEETDGFVTAGCESCGGPLKPNVVFFGENVPKPRVERCYAMVEDAKALVVLGSSLTVMSGLRFVKHAHKLGLPIVIVNRGATRGDPLATHRIDSGTSEWLRSPPWHPASESVA